jgi:hypothetical protein
LWWGLIVIPPRLDGDDSILLGLALLGLACLAPILLLRLALLDLGVIYVVFIFLTFGPGALAWLGTPIAGSARSVDQLAVADALRLVALGIKVLLGRVPWARYYKYGSLQIFRSTPAGVGE